MFTCLRIDVCSKAPADAGAFRVSRQEVALLDGDLDVNALLTAADAARYAGLLDEHGKPKVSMIVNWRNRGLLPVAADDRGREIRDSRGRPMYRLLDVAKADARTREHAAQMAARLAARAA